MKLDIFYPELDTYMQTENLDYSSPHTVKWSLYRYNK